jgi:hypothetical protein
LTTRSAAACVARSEKLGLGPTEEARRRLLRRLAAASESRREKAESRLRASSAGVASAAAGPHGRCARIWFVSFAVGRGSHACPEDYFLV